jgi:glycine betaine/proline transport system substrate-binding protein
MRKLFSVAIALAVVAAACGDGAGDGGDNGNGDDNPTISLVVNPWTASRLNAEVAKVIIEQELGNTVEITEIDENAMFTGMADGTLDAVLEIWPSGVTEDEQAFIDEGSVVNLGDLGAVGKIGWFVPRYVIEEHPELATWEGFQDPELASMFATAETGDSGRFLGTDPSYSQYDEQIIENLDLPLQVVFSGSEPATVAELDARVAANEPIVMYWWTPTAAVAAYDLVNVELPEYTEECGESAASGDGGVDCDYPEDVLFKAASGELEEKDPDVFTFLQAFTITTEDQLEMLPAVEIDGEDPAAVAEQWVADHEDIWREWLP